MVKGSTLSVAPSADYTSSLKKKGLDALLRKLNEKIQQYAGEPAFLSPRVAKVLAEKFDIRPIGELST